MVDLQAVYVIWLREMKRFSRDRSQILVATVRPLSWLFFLGYGLSPFFHMARVGGYTQFILPGIVMMALLFTSIQSAISIIWDREFGFLKEMLVAPVSRTSIVLGKASGGATLALAEGAIVLLTAPLFGLHLSAWRIAGSIGVMALVATGLTGLGIVIASRMRSFEGFGAIMNFVVMPLFLLSGSLFPLTGIPRWLDWLTRLNPLTYGVDALRGLLINTHHFSMTLNLAVVGGFAAAMIGTAVILFNRQEG